MDLVKLLCYFRCKKGNSNLRQSEISWLKHRTRSQETGTRHQLPWMPHEMKSLVFTC